MDSSASLPNALTLGALLALGISILGFKRRWLSLSGSFAAVLIGAGVFASGWMATSALLFLFLSSAAIARFARVGIGSSDDTSHQSEPRTAVQVLAVGSVPAFACLLAELDACAACVPIALASLAFATADTWATDVGMTATSAPRLLGFGRRVPSGMSGGMTFRGTLASFGGAIALALIAAPFGLRTMLIVTTGGFAGSLLDSVLGAVLQTRFRCAVCGRETEAFAHCNAPAIRTRPGLSNAGVNFVTSVFVAALSFFALK
jgi:uncharacterized protein (TIGR00297 family)